jgi:CBS domain-containing protein
MPTAQDVISQKPGDVAIIGEEGTVMEAAKVMSDRHIGALVVSRGEKVIGIFTERDVLNRIVAKGRNPTTTLVKDVMTSPVACCQPTTKLAECRSVMTEKRIRHLPVVTDGTLVGMISIGDIVALENHDKQMTIEYLHEYLHTGTR